MHEILKVKASRRLKNKRLDDVIFKQKYTLQNSTTILKRFLSNGNPKCNLMHFRWKIYKIKMFSSNGVLYIIILFII